jgi:LPXTG-motif cell wall-anchored protein
MVFPSAASKVAAAQHASGGWVQVRQVRGLGAITDNIPPWAIWGAAGLAAGGLVGYFLLRKKRRRK